MKHFLNHKAFAEWTGISVMSLYTLDTNHRLLVHSHRNLIEVEVSAEAVCTHYESKYEVGTLQRQTAALIRYKLAEFSGKAKKIYINTNDVVDKLGFTTGNQLLALKERDPSFPKGTPTRARSGGMDCLFDVEEIDEYMERNWIKLKINGSRTLSCFWVKQFIRGEFAPARG